MDFKDKAFAVLSRDLFLRIWSLGSGVIIARILDQVNIGIKYSYSYSSIIMEDIFRNTFVKKRKYSLKDGRGDCRV